MDREARRKELRGAKFAKLLNDIRLFSEFAEIANVPELRKDADVFRDFAEESMRGYDSTKTREENLASNCKSSAFVLERNLAYSSTPASLSRLGRKLLEELATETEVQIISRERSALLNKVSTNINVQRDPMLEDETVPTGSATEEAFGVADHGVEEEVKMSLQELKKDLGVDDKVNRHLWAMAEWATNSGVTMWDEPDKFENDGSPKPNALIDGEKITVTECDLRWVQYAGLHSLVRKSFTARKGESGVQGGLLLADEVGIGKTAQALAFIAWLNLAIELRKSGKPLPPIIREFLLFFSNNFFGSLLLQRQSPVLSGRRLSRPRRCCASHRCAEFSRRAMEDGSAQIPQARIRHLPLHWRHEGAQRILEQRRRVGKMQVPPAQEQDHNRISRCDYC